MTKQQLYHFMSQQKLAVISTISPGGKPEAALIGIAVSENLEIIFDTVKTSRKYQNLLLNPQVAMVIGWDNEITVQYEGVAVELTDGDTALKEIYYAVYRDGRERAETWPDLVQFKITPAWIRYSDFNAQMVIEESDGPF